MNTARIMTALALTVSLSACDTKPADDADDPQDPIETNAEEEGASEDDQTVSILRPDIEQPELPEMPLEALRVTIGFPDGGSELNEAARSKLEEVFASEQLAQGGPIILRAHSDAGGSDRANERASQARGLAVAEWLIGKGVASDRIDVIVFGEQNPVEPNALPDGSPNEAGRAANRRVELAISTPDKAVDTSTEQLP